MWLSDTLWLVRKIDSEKLRLPPPGSFAASALRISPSPCVKSVATLVLRCSYVSTAPRPYVARTREVHIGWTRPWRKSSVRCHISRTGLLPNARDASAASYAASLNRCLPNEPPPCMTWQVTDFAFSFSIFAMFCCATIGFFRLDQISALSDRTSATAQFVSSGLLLRK